MAKRVFIVHGWDGSPERDWMPWAKKVLEEKGFEVHIPSMPDPSRPKIETWVPYLAKKIGEPDSQTILIGHSIGCQTILRYLQTIPTNEKFQKVILIAGWVSLTPIAVRKPEDQRVVKPWFEIPIDYEKVKSSAKKFVAVFSDDDPLVPYKENSKTYKERLGAKIILKRGMGHFSQGEGVTKLPFLLDLID